MSYTLEQFAVDKAQAALGAPYAAYRCSQYYLRTVLPTCWQGLKLSMRAHNRPLAESKASVMYWSDRIHKARVQLWRYFTIALNNAERLNNHALLETLRIYKEKIARIG